MGLDHTTRMGHPRSFGCMRLEKGPATPPGCVVYETPDGEKLMWPDNCKSPILMRQIIDGRVKWTPAMGEGNAR